MKLHESMIAEQSHMLLDGFGQEVVGLRCAVERKLEAIGDPNLSWRMDTGETSFLSALAGKRRDFLVIEHERLREYAVLISARRHGQVLHVAWMVLVTKRLASDVRRAVQLGVEPGTRFDISVELDVFDVMDLKAFVGITRLALKYAIREVTGEKVHDELMLETE